MTRPDEPQRQPGDLGGGWLLLGYTRAGFVSTDGITWTRPGEPPIVWAADEPAAPHAIEEPQQ